MIDFKLTQNGDIDIAEAYQYPCFMIQYYIPARDTRYKNNVYKKARRYAAFRIDFDTDVRQHQKQPKDALLIQFMTQREIYRYRPVTINSVTGLAETAQEITIRLKTEKGEFEFLDNLGSELVTLRHTDIKSDTTLVQAQQYAEEATSEVDGVEELIVTAQWLDDASRYKHERLKLSFDTERDTIYEATI